MLDYFPGYNKFRTVSMTLIMAEFAMPVLAMLALHEVISGEIPKKEFLKGLEIFIFWIGRSDPDISGDFRIFQYVHSL